MKRSRLVAPLVASVALLAAGCGGGSDEAATTEAASTGGETSGETLHGSVGPGFEISMDRTDVAPGTYTLIVDDKSDAHNFHISGTGVDEATDVSGTGEETFTVTLEPGTYTFVCDPHADSMRGTLTVG